jgi:hypothetical protein
MSIEKQQSTTGTFYPVLSISFQKSPWGLSIHLWWYFARRAIFSFGYDSSLNRLEFGLKAAVSDEHRERGQLVSFAFLATTFSFYSYVPKSKI